MCSFIKGLSNVAKTFLSCSIPYVESDLVAMEFYAFDFKVDPNGAEIVSLEGVLAVTN